MKILFILFLSFLSTHFTHADTFISGKKTKKILVKGPARLTNVKASSVTVDGTLAFNNLDVVGDVTITKLVRDDSQNLKCRHLVSGKSMTANNLKCESALICGSACLENFEVSGDTIIKGDTKIKNGKIQNLNLFSNEIHLQNVNVNDIIIEKPRLPFTNQILYLKGKTLVAGSINFKSDQGTIFMDKDAIVNGEINGAVVNKEGAIVSKE